jgi:hypothetical protein
LGLVHPAVCVRNKSLDSIPLWGCWLVWWPAFAVLLAGCSLDSGQKSVVSLPTGHYEGTVSYQGTELQTVLDLRESRPGQLEADLHFPEIEDLGFAATSLSYTEPQLRFEEAAQPGGMQITAIREGDFLRGILAQDSARADFVWVRRGQPEPRSYQEKQLPAQANLNAPALTVLVPNDTASLHSAVALFTDATHQNVANARANQLAGQGFITTVVTVAPATSPEDSTALRTATTVLLALRRAPPIDTTRIGVWARGTTAAAVVPAATLVSPRAAFVVLENVPVSSADAAKPFQALSRQRVPTLGLYAAADTSLNVQESTQRLRGGRGSRRSGIVIRTFPKADANFRVPGGLSAEGKWTWPRPAAGYTTAVKDWRSN